MTSTLHHMRLHLNLHSSGPWWWFMTPPLLIAGLSLAQSYKKTICRDEWTSPHTNENEWPFYCRIHLNGPCCPVAGSRSLPCVSREGERDWGGGQTKPIALGSCVPFELSYQYVTVMTVCSGRLKFEWAKGFPMWISKSHHQPLNSSDCFSVMIVWIWICGRLRKRVTSFMTFFVLSIYFLFLVGSLPALAQVLLAR